MKEERYSISEASRLLNLENHVLRYWEEQLGLNIPRNEQGQRYYMEKEIGILSCIKEMKNKGFQLKAVKEILPDLENNKEIDIHKLMAAQVELEEAAAPELLSAEKEPDTSDISETSDADETISADETIADTGPGDEKLLQFPSQKKAALPEQSIRQNQEKMMEFEAIMGRIVEKALKNQAREMGDIMGDRIREKVVKEIDDSLDDHMARTEEYFKKLDESIRIRQRARQEAAAAREEGGKKKSRFFRKNKRKI